MIIKTFENRDYINTSEYGEMYQKIITEMQKHSKVELTIKICE